METDGRGTQAVLKKWRGEIQSGKYPLSTVQSAIDQYIFSERTRKMLRRRLYDDIGFERLAEEFDLSSVQARRIVNSAERILMTHLA